MTQISRFTERCVSIAQRVTDERGESAAPSGGGGFADYALVSLHCPRIYLDTSYRMTIDLLKEMPQITRSRLGRFVMHSSGWNLDLQLVPIPIVHEKTTCPTSDEDNSLDWLFQFGEIESMEDDYPRFIEQVGAIAMGSTTYEWIIEHENLLEEPEKWPYETPTWVFSSRELSVVKRADIRFVQGDVAPVHAEMAEAAGDKNVWLVGGGDLAG